MSKTITGTYYGPVQVQFAGNNPFSFAGKITVDAYTGLAFQPGAGTNWTVNNSGTIQARRAAYSVYGPFGGLVFGSNLQAVASGTLTNRAGGYIYGDTVGVMVYGATANITNLAGGTIGARRYGINASGEMTVTNAGLVSSRITGVKELFGGAVTNQGGGTIHGDAIGVWVVGASTVTNQSGGTISGNDGIQQDGASSFNAGVIDAFRYGVFLQSGSFTNQSGGQITARSNGVRILSGSVDNQSGATITATGTIVTTTGVYLRAGGSLTNSGLIQATTAGSGVYQASGSVTNNATGTITGGFGVRLDSGTLVNAGLVSGTTAAVQFKSNSASNRVVLQPGGAFSGAVKGGGSGVLELASAATAGTIGNLASFTGFASVQVDTGASWVLNGANTLASGIALANAGTLAGGFSLAGGNTLDNTGTIIGNAGTAATFGNAGNNTVLLHAGAAISGLITGGSSVSNTARLVAGGIGELVGFQNVFSGFNRLQVDSGAQWTLSGTLAAGATLANSGAMTGYLYVGTGGMVTNAAGATITSNQIFLINGKSGPATVVNAGTLAASSSFSVLLTKGGEVSNAASGLITGRGVVIDFAPGLVDNSGSIQASGASGDGVTLRAGGTVSNAAGGAITGQRFGVNLALQGGTLRNAGTITGSSGTAVVFGGVGSNLLTLYAGAAFSGVVQGSASASNRLELASGSGTGTLTGLASNFLNFARVDVDSGANWQLDSSTIASGMTLNNAGTISGTGVTLSGSGLLSNASSGAIAGAGVAAVTGLAGGPTVVNAGTIAPASGGAGIYLQGGGSVTNAAGGIIGGTFPLLFTTGAGSVTNSGTIISAGDSLSNGILLIAGGSVTNTASGTIGGQRVGVFLPTGGSVSNAGTISASSGVAVYFGGTGASRLVVNPGAVFNGSAAFKGAADATLELAGTGSGTLSGLGTSFVNVDTLQIDSGAHWTLTGSNTLAAGQTLVNAGALTLLNTSLNDGGVLQNDGAIVLDPSTLTVAGLTGTGTVSIETGSTLEVTGTVAAGETISLDGSNAVLVLDTPAAMAGAVTNFGDGDTIRLEGVDPASVAYAGGTLSFAGGSFALSLANGGPVHAVSDGAGGAELSLLCFCAGTHIATPDGEVPVERLAVGDRVTTASGVVRPIVWIGIGRVLATRGRRNAATPIIVRKGALADNVPHHDLHVTKGHSLHQDGVLIPVEFLVNHRSIVWDDRAQEVAIYHVELATHDVLLANGAPAESYRDDGNRWLFRNANSGWGLSPQPPCAPVLTGGPIVDAAWHRLLQRAGGTSRIPTTDQPNLHIVADGKRVDGRRLPNGVYSFRLPTTPCKARIVSRSGVPSELGLARDPRELGVALRRVMASCGAKVRLIEAADPVFGDGFHPFEEDNGFRWTDGDAPIPAALFDGLDGPVVLDLYVAGRTLYSVLGEEQVGAAA